MDLEPPQSRSPLATDAGDDPETLAVSEPTRGRLPWWRSDLVELGQLLAKVEAV
ncbi:MAG: hypothetical protein AB7V43_05465 [Acidimicrobiia bacterium]